MHNTPRPESRANISSTHLRPHRGCNILLHHRLVIPLSFKRRSLLPSRGSSGLLEGSSLLEIPPRDGLESKVERDVVVVLEVELGLLVDTPVSYRARAAAPAEAVLAGVPESALAMVALAAVISSVAEARAGPHASLPEHPGDYCDEHKESAAEG